MTEEREKNKALDLQALHAVCEDICPPAKVPLKPGEKVYDFDGFVPDSDLRGIYPSLIFLKYKFFCLFDIYKSLQHFKLCMRSYAVTNHSKLLFFFKGLTQARKGACRGTGTLAVKTSLDQWTGIPLNGL